MYTHFNYVYILVLATLKMTTWVDETCQWPLCSEIASMKSKCIYWSLVTVCVHKTSFCSPYDTLWSTESSLAQVYKIYPFPWEHQANHVTACSYMCVYTHASRFNHKQEMSINWKRKHCSFLPVWKGNASWRTRESGNTLLLVLSALYEIILLCHEDTVLKMKVYDTAHNTFHYASSSHLIEASFKNGLDVAERERERDLNFVEWRK